ncbi:MAG: ribose-phosphate diphosphokinase [Patescibacteria group bacterium]
MAAEPEGEGEMEKLLIFDAGAHPALCQTICQLLEIEPGQAEVLEFSNGDIANKLLSDVRGSDCFVISTQAQPVQFHIQTTLSLVKNLRIHSDGMVRLIWGYMPGIRSDKVDQLRISLGARDMADQITAAGAHGVVILEPHFPQIVGFFDQRLTRVEPIKTASIFLNEIVNSGNFDLNNCVVVAADLGSAKRSGTFATRLHVELAFIDKRRNGNTETIKPVAVIGNVKGRDCLVPDDEICSGSTFIEDAIFLLENGARTVTGFMTHAPLTNLAALRKIEAISEITGLHVTDSIPISQEKQATCSKLRIHSVAPLLAGLIRCVHERRSIHGPHGFLQSLYDKRLVKG